MKSKKRRCQSNGSITSGPGRANLARMPTYEYEPCSGDCRICKGGFSLTRPVTAPPLENCPLCRKPVHKLISSFSTPKILKPLSVADARSAGFKVYKRVGKGEYERQ